MSEWKEEDQWIGSELHTFRVRVDDEGNALKPTWRQMDQKIKDDRYWNSSGGTAGER